MAHRGFLSALLVALAGCGGGGDSAPPEIAVRYELGVLGPPARGVQVGRPFSVRVEFTEIGTTAPATVPADEVLTIEIDSGSGTLSGTTSVQASGTSASFDDLVLDATGEFRLVVHGTSAAASAATAPFTVGRQLELAFVSLPAVVYSEHPFAVEVAVVDPGSGAAVDPGYAVAVTVAVGGGTGASGTVGDAAAIRLDDLVVTASATTTVLTATAFGFQDAGSAPLPVDRVTVRGLVRTGSNVVGGSFALEGTVVSVATAQPVALDPPLRVRVEASAAAGVLGGTREADTVGSAFSIGPMTWDAAGDVTLTVVGPGLDSAAVLERFGYVLRIQAQGPTVGLPHEPLGPFEFRLEDATGVPFAGPAAPLAWLVTRDADGRVVASGAEAFAGGVATVSPGGFEDAGTYRLAGAPGSSPPTVGMLPELGLEIAFALVDAPGPFAALRSVRVGAPYADSVAWAALPGTVAQAPRFGVLRGTLPDGLSLDQATGELVGHPTTAGDHDFVLWARQGASDLQPIRCALSVFAADESDVDPTPPDFAQPGPHAGQETVVDDTFGFTSSFDGVSYTTAVRIWLPPVAGAPVLVLHRNREVDHTDYDSLGRHLASWGIALVSVEDWQSFRDTSGRAPNPTYDLVVVEAGIESGTAFLEAALARIAARTATTGDPLEGAIDVERAFLGGHGRGGGSSHAAQHRWLVNKATGYVHLMPFDLRLSPLTEPPGDPQGTPMYPIPTLQPRLPQLIVSAGNDGDTFFPIADQLGDRATGPSTFVTVWGGVSSYTTDQRVYDENLTTITRAAHQAATFRYVTAFVKRWADNDRSLERALYGDLAAGSSEVGVFAERGLAERVLVDDFQDVDPTRNVLGGSNSLSAGSRVELSVYPPLAGFSTLGIQHSIVFLSAVASAVYSTEFPSLDVRRARRVAFRVGQASAAGYDWVTVRVRLRDGSGSSAAVTVWDRSTQTGALPDFDPAAPNAYDRFVGVEVPLSGFTGVDLADLRALELVFETDGAVAIERQIYLDDLRFE